MITVDLSIEKFSLAQLLHLAAQQDVIIKLKDGREFVFASLEIFDWALTMQRDPDEVWDLWEKRSKMAGSRTGS